MIVSVSLFGLQRTLAKTDRIQVPLSDKLRIVADLFGYIKERHPELSLSKEMVLVTVNNHTSSLDQRLCPNDDVSFIPHIGGG
ncbi:MoaD/ThiS family protein [Thermodesulfobacteriota bacterium]